MFFSSSMFLFMTMLLFLRQETTPLAGSSAGAVVCAAIASGSSMEEALKATKILAEDCRLRGTAFRLGVLLFTPTTYALQENKLVKRLYVHVFANDKKK